MFVRKSEFESVVNELINAVEDYDDVAVVKIVHLEDLVGVLWEAVANLESVVYGAAETAAPKKAPARKTAKPTEAISAVGKPAPKRTTRKA